MIDGHELKWVNVPAAQGYWQCCCGFQSRTKTRLGVMEHQARVALGEAEPSSPSYFNGHYSGANSMFSWAGSFDQQTIPRLRVRLGQIYRDQRQTIRATFYDEAGNLVGQGEDTIVSPGGWTAATGTLYSLDPEERIFWSDPLPGDQPNED